MEHPQALNDQKKGGPVVRFARNKLCALVKPELAVDSKNLLERMLEKDVKVGTSTPNADPSGDYAFEVFRMIRTTRCARLIERSCCAMGRGSPTDWSQRF